MDIIFCIRLWRQTQKNGTFLADHEKINVNSPMNLFDLNDVDAIITDYVFSDEIKDKYKDTEFIEVK